MPTRAKNTPRRNTAGDDVWQIGSALVAFLAALPLLAILWLAWFPSENIWPHLLDTVLPRYLQNTLLLMGGVGVLVFVFGVGSAYLVSQFDFTGRAGFEWLLLLPFALPTYVMAYVYTDLLEFAGPVQATLRQWFDWQLASDYWFPSIRSLGGAIIFMALVLYPYVYILARVAFLEQSAALRDVSRLLGRSEWRVFWHLALPIARPAVAVGVALALMETLNDFGTVDFFAIPTLTAGLYDVWLNMGNLGGAAQIASVMLAFVLVLLALEYAGRRRQRFYESARGARHPPVRLRRAANWAAFLCCGLLVVAGFLLPFGLLLKNAVRYFATAWTPAFSRYLLNSLTVSVVAAAVCVVLAIVVAYALRLHPGRRMRVVTRIASLGYAVPGAVLAVGVSIPFAAFDNTLDALSRQYLGVSTGLLLSGTLVALLFAYVMRFLAVAIGCVESSFAKISTSIDPAARTLGHSSGQTLVRFHWPLLRGGALSAALIVFVDSMKELPATLLLRPFNFETLATHVYYLAADEMLERSSLGALCIVLAGLVPVLVLSRNLTSAHRFGTTP